jgi:hypothetical protein
MDTVNVFLPEHQRHKLQRHRGAAGSLPAVPTSANPLLTQIHPTRIPVSGDYQLKPTLMSSRCATMVAWYRKRWK